MAIDGQESLTAASGGIGVGKVLTHEEALEQFKAAIKELDELEADGKIAILERHVESQSGKKYVGRVRFKRIS